MKKRILICSNAYPPHFIGGAELVAHAQAKQLQDSGHEVFVFTGDPREQGQRHSQWREDYEGIAVLRLRLTFEDYDYKFVNFTHRDIEDSFKKVLSFFSPDIIHFHNIVGLSVGLIHIAKSHGIKTIVTLHDHWGFCFKNTLIKNNNEICRDFSRCSECMPLLFTEDNIPIPIKMRKDFLALQLEEVDAFISPSQYLAEQYIRAGIPPEKMFVVWNGVDVQKFSRIKKIPDLNGNLRFTFIGNFGKHKGIHILLEAVRQLDRKKKFRINLIGSGDLLQKYQDEIRTTEWADRIHFWGKIENIEQAYADTDVFILPSIWPENQPVTITEAMAAGIPVIAPDSGGIPELVTHNRTGFLFDSGNASDLARKMTIFLEQQHLLDSFGIQAFEQIKDKTVQNQVKDVVKIYSEILDHPLAQPLQRKIVACIGGRFPPSNAGEMGIAAPLFSRPGDCRFVMFEWLQEDQKKNIQFAWIQNSSTQQDILEYFLSNRIPLLVPSDNLSLTELCKKTHCGLFYSDILELEACISYILGHDHERKLMGKNGYNYYSQKNKKKTGWGIFSR